MEAGDWKSAVHMYRGTDAWEDAYRVAQSHGGPNAAKQVRYSGSNGSKVQKSPKVAWFWTSFDGLQFFVKV